MTQNRAFHHKTDINVRGSWLIGLEVEVNGATAAGVTWYQLRVTKCESHPHLVGKLIDCVEVDIIDDESFVSYVAEVEWDDGFISNTSDETLGYRTEGPRDGSGTPMGGELVPELNGLHVGIKEFDYADYAIHSLKHVDEALSCLKAAEDVQSDDDPIEGPGSTEWEMLREFLEVYQGNLTKVLVDPGCLEDDDPIWIDDEVHVVIHRNKRMIITEVMVHPDPGCKRVFDLCGYTKEDREVYVYNTEMYVLLHGNDGERLSCITGDDVDVRPL